jgi:hypothetical protein
MNQLARPRPVPRPVPPRRRSPQSMPAARGRRSLTCARRQPDPEHLTRLTLKSDRLALTGSMISVAATTLPVAVIGAAVAFQQWWITLLGCLASLAFWRREARLLRAERLLLVLERFVEEGRPEVKRHFTGALEPDFIKLAEEVTQTKYSLWRTFLRPALVEFYGVAVLLQAATGVGVLIWS